MKNIATIRKEMEDNAEDIPESLENYFDAEELNYLSDLKEDKDDNTVYTVDTTETVDDPIERDMTEEERRILVLLCAKDIYLFAVRYFSHYLKSTSSSLHKYLYSFLSRELGKSKEKRIKGFKKAIAAPRGNAKTTIISLILPLWCVAYNKKNFIIIVSDTAGQAEDFLSDIKRELATNLKLLRDFPHIAGKGPVWRMGEVITANNIKLLSLGSGNNIRGRRFGKNRPDMIIGDDLENSEMIRSEVTREFIRFKWFNKDVLYAGSEKGSKDHTDFLVVGTVLGKDSLLNALLNPEEYPEWTSMRFSAIQTFNTSDLWKDWEKILKNRFDDDRIDTALQFFEDHKEEMLDGAKELWPEGDPYYNLMMMKVSDPSGFETEKMNSPVDYTKIYVREDELHWENFHSNPKIKAVLKNRRNPTFGALDPSLGKKADSGDYSVIISIVRDVKSGYLYVIDIDVKRRGVEEQIESILIAHQKFKYNQFAVETNAFQYVVAENLRKRSRETGIYVPVKDINNYQDKKMRFEGILPLLTDGTVVFDKYRFSRNQQYSLGIEQITTFTGQADRHDDVPDCLEMAIRVAKKPRFKTITSQNG